MDINNSLMWAVRRGDIETARQLIEDYGLSYSNAWSDGYNLLRVATGTGNSELTKLLLLKGAKVNSRNSIVHPSDTPLHLAVKDCDVEVIEMLLDRGAMINLKNEYGHSPLYNSLKYNNTEITKLLLNRGANVNDINSNGITPLHIAVQTGCLQTVEYLLNCGACVNPDWRLSLSHADHVDFAYRGREGYTPLHLSVECGTKDIVKLLLDRNANIDAKSLKGATPLHIAAKKGHIEIVEDLLNHGACINSADVEGFTPLHFAVAENRENVIKLLFNRGADIEITTKDNLTPLYIAIKQRNEKLVSLLLKHGANVDAQNADGKTILHAAIETGNSEIIESVLENCPDINNESNESCLYLALYGYNKINETVGENSDPYFRYLLRRHIGDVGMIVEQHIVKMEAANLYVHKEYLLAIDSRSHDDFREKCKEEMANLKREKIANSNISFYDILLKSASQLAVYAKNEDIIQVLNSNDFRIKFPIYSGMINGHFRKEVAKEGTAGTLQ